jgi:hypothetical protein
MLAQKSHPGLQARDLFFEALVSPCDAPSMSLPNRCARDAGAAPASMKARNLFRAGARPTFFVAKKVGKENTLRRIQIRQLIFGQDFSTGRPCLVEK